jgi:3',5'-cyclic AMP phosphodiesterase CpdA
MPVHLPALTRRRFIGQTLVGISGLLVGCKSAALARGRTDDFWALFSDTHISADAKLVTRNVNMTAHLQQAVREVCGLERRPAGILVAGDCAYSTGLTSDYSALTALLEPLQTAGMDVHLTLGNHDDRENFRFVVPAPRATGLQQHVALLKTTHANWFILDSLEKTNSTPGLLGKDQLNWLASTLDANTTKPALVMVHHNPGISGNSGLKDTVALFDVIRPRKQVKAYIYGHTHAWSVDKDSEGLHLVNLPAVAYTFREGDPSGWVSAQLRPDSLDLKFYSLNTAHPAHGREFSLTYRAA